MNKGSRIQNPARQREDRVANSRLKIRNPKSKIRNTCTVCLTLMVAGTNLHAFSKSVAAEGKIVPAGGTYRVAVAPPQSVLAELLVKEGDWLEAGQAIARLKGLPILQAQVVEARAAVETANTALKIAEQQARIGKLNAAKMMANEKEARQMHASAIAKIDRNILDLEKVIEDKNPPKRDRAEIEYNIQRLEREQVELLSVFPTTLERIQAEAAVVQAQALLVEMEVAVARSNLNAAQAQLAIARAREAEATVKAPRAGEVISVFSHAGEAVGPQGILEMGNTREMHVEAEVYIDDIAKVEVGDGARITGDGIAVYLEGVVVEIEGKVARNALTSADPSAYTDQRVIKVIIQLNADDSEQVKRLLNAQVIARIKPPTHAQ